MPYRPGDILVSIARHSWLSADGYLLFPTPDLGSSFIARLDERGLPSASIGEPVLVVALASEAAFVIARTGMGWVNVVNHKALLFNSRFTGWKSKQR